MKWEIGLLENGQWVFSGDYDQPSDAVVALTFKLGVVLLANQESNGTFSVKRDDGSLVACVRSVGPVLAVGEKPGRLGPLRRWRGLTWVGWLNTFVLQFLGVRLCYTVEDNNTISGWGYCFAWPLARRVGKVRNIGRRVRRECDHGVSFDEQQWRRAYSAFRAAIAVCTPEEQAKGWSAFDNEVRHRWPRLDGPCPKGCGYEGIAYASTTHYIAGDW